MTAKRKPPTTRKPNDLRVEYVDPKTLKADPRNPRRIAPDARERLKRGIERFGMPVPLLVRAEDRVVIGGHQRLSIALELKMPRVPIIRRAGLTASEAKALNILLNNPKAQGEWDEDALGALLAEMQADDFDLTLTGFDDADIRGLLGDVGEVDFGGLPSGDKSKFEQMTFTLTGDQADVIREAMAAADDAGAYVDTGNENSNGNALARVAEFALGAFRA